ncbi:unnamed protein product [Trichobilharzia szidati]|nr:unnamed protein product [Trichobilharzia szidati]
MSNSTYHGVAKWLGELLQPLHKLVVNHNVKDVFEFIANVNDINVNGKQMLSLDVASLFTNVPLMETVDFICQQILEKQIDIGIPVISLKELLLRCTMNVHFLFNNLYYRQIDGIAMGSPLGPILADFFLAKIENGPLRQVIEETDSYFRYVDDTFIILDVKTDKNEMLKKFNDAHPSLIFTCEEEHDGGLHFLDVQLSRREDGSLKRDVYRKPTSVGQYTHFLSFVPIRYKINLVRCLTNRARRICTDDSLENELGYIQNTLVQMGFPSRFVRRHMNTRYNKEKPTTVKKKELFMKLQFNGDVASEVLHQRLSRAIKRTYTAATLCLSFSSRPILIAQVKDKLPSCATSMCIYKFSCSCGESYIGRTTRQLNKRINEHLPSWFGKGQIKSIRSSILAHLIDSGHQVDKNSAFKVIYRIPSSLSNGIRNRLLHLAEAMGIRENNPSLCIQKKFVLPLSLPWPR